jgi:hypothetical protein
MASHATRPRFEGALRARVLTDTDVMLKSPLPLSLSLSLSSLPQIILDADTPVLRSDQELCRDLAAMRSKRNLEKPRIFDHRRDICGSPRRNTSLPSSALAIRARIRSLHSQIITFAFPLQREQRTRRMSYDPQMRANNKPPP